MEIIDTECVLKSCLHFLLCVLFEIHISVFRRIEFPPRATGLKFLATVLGHWDEPKCPSEFAILWRLH